jgi:hypothetical protein
MPTLLALEVIEAKSPSNEIGDLAAAAGGVVREAAMRVDEATNGATAVVFGIARGTRSLNLMTRRQEAAALLSVTPDHFRKSLESARVQLLADELLALNSTFQARLAHTLNKPSPQESRLNVDWLARHEAYRRIWTPVYALRSDLSMLLGLLSDEAEWPDVADRVMNLLWRRAQFTKALDQFVEEYGGLWLLSDPEKESQAAESIYQLARLSPSGTADDSWLRLRLAEAEEHELDSFSTLVWENEQGKEMVAIWLEWARTCNCQPDNLSGTCPVHGWMAACDQFTQLIDEDWDQVADWYRRERASNSRSK